MFDSEAPRLCRGDEVLLGWVEEVLLVKKSWMAWATGVLVPFS